MQIEEFPLDAPSLEEIVDVIKPALESNYKSSSISVVDCPDLRQPPFGLAAEGLSGRECIADIGGQPNLFPEPRLDRKYSSKSIVKVLPMLKMGKQLILTSDGMCKADGHVSASRNADRSWCWAFLSSRHQL